ncbi:MAG: Asp-tRNA(Asn)/Glu-tRNA(Gln) amidotransferase subunit GatC [Chloroflexota bacterium]
MALTEDVVKHLATLAHIRLSPENIQDVAHELSSVIDHFDVLRQLDTSSIAATDHALSDQNVLREDIVHSSWPVESVLANAPRRSDDFFEIEAIFE